MLLNLSCNEQDICVCQVEVLITGILVLDLTLENDFSELSYPSWWQRKSSHIQPVLHTGKFLIGLFHWEFYSLTQKVLDFVRLFFLYVILPFTVLTWHAVCRINWYVYFEPCLDTWNRSYLVTVDGPFNALLNLAC